MSAETPQWIDVGAVADVKLSPGWPVKVAGHWIAIFRVDGVWRAIDNNCPHASAPLCDGSLTNGKIACYLHWWEFDLATGACDVGPQWNVRTYPVRERDGRLEVAWSGPPPA